MFRLLLTTVVLVGLAAQAEALPFKPDYARLDVERVRFVETGTDRVCFNCEDQDPDNDFKLALVFVNSIESTPDQWQGDRFGYADFTGTTLREFGAIDLHIVIDVKVTMAMLNNDPAWMKQYPHASVGYGTMEGVLFGWPGSPTSQSFLVEDCCGGSVHGIDIWTANMESVFYLPPGPYDEPGYPSSYFQSFNLEVMTWGYPYVTYTPVVSTPEPASLLLLGGGLVAGWRRRRR